jgi:type IV secretion system protein VirD4
MTASKRIPEIPVLFVLDEFLSLGPFPQFKDAIRTHAGAGVRLWFFLQDMATLEEHYPKSWSTFMNASVKLFFGTNDAVTGRSISDNLLGNTTVGYFSGSVQQGGSSTPGDILSHGNTSNNVNASVNLAQKPLLNGTEVVSLLAGKLDNGARQGILSLSDMPHPVHLRMVPWFLGEKCRNRVTSNR